MKDHLENAEAVKNLSGEKTKNKPVLSLVLSSEK